MSIFGNEEFRTVDKRAVDNFNTASEYLNKFLAAAQADKERSDLYWRCLDRAIELLMLCENPNLKPGPGDILNRMDIIMTEVREKMKAKGV